MANSQQYKILKSGVDKWNKWREENSHIQIDLSGADLSGISLKRLRGFISFPEQDELETEELPNPEQFDYLLSDAYLNSGYFQGYWNSSAINAGANLHNANLSRANLRNANLEKAYLVNANLSGADLSSADLSYANLNNVNFSSTNLNGANLKGSNLLMTNFNGTKLNDTNFADAELNQSVFCQTNLGTCKGFESIKVSGKCAVDFFTLRSSGYLPKSFLLKIGLPELYIDYLPDFYQPEGIRLYPAFLSHSWANKPFARKLYEALIARGVNVFFDEKKMKPGDDIFTSLSRGIELYDKTILVCSEASLNSWWVDQELELVFEKERKLQKEVGEKIGLLIPIRIDDAIESWGSGKRMAIKQRIIGDFRGWADDGVFERALDELVQALNADRPNIKPVSHLPRKPKSSQ